MKKYTIFSICCIALVFAGCSDQWLAVKRDISLTVPATLADVRALLNNDLLRYDNTCIAELYAGEYRLTDANFNSRTPLERAGVTWVGDPFEGSTSAIEWNNTFQQVLQCNLALETLDGITPSTVERRTWQILRGQALFFRAKAFFNLTQLFTVPYDPGTLDGKLGIPLRLHADVNATTTRATLGETYGRILTDLTLAAQLLDPRPLDVRQTSRPAAFAALARCYLVMREYGKAGLYADSALQLHSTLLDYNGIITQPTFPIAPYNSEVMLSSTLFPLYGPLNRNVGSVAEAAYARYEEHDLRKSVFFIQKTDGTMGYRGSYMGSSFGFHGSTTGEMLLIRAESAARAGHTTEALADINALLAKRLHRDHVVPVVAVDAGAALKLILLERKKELINRGLRWMDLRRLNFEPEYAETLTRTVGGTTYTLPPNDPRYALPIPDYVIQTTGIAQNNR